MEYKLLVFDPEKCIGCGNCLTVCPTNTIIFEPSSYGHGSTIKNTLKVVNGRISDENICHHCIGNEKLESAPCISACPEKILKKNEEGITILDYDLTEEDVEKYQEILEICKKCDGTPCVEACAYNHITIVPIFIKSQKFVVPVKCNACEGDPECVKVCPTDALRYISFREKFLDKLKLAEELAKSTGLPVKLLKVFT